MRSSNPAMNPALFAQSRTYGIQETMTVGGTVNKCFILWALVALPAMWVWGKVMTPAPALGYDVARTGAGVAPFIWGGLFGGMIFGLATAFKPQWARITAPLYAVCEGMLLGGISAYYELRFPGIVMQAVALTFGTMFCMLSLYKSRIIPVTDKLRMGIMSATGAIFFVYLGSMLLGFFGVRVPFIHEGGMIGIGFSVIVVGVAAFNLLLDFDIIERGAEQGAAKVMEWYGAFALTVTLVWLYLEMLRLLSKLNSRR